MIFIDSNVPMYAAGREHAHREKALKFLAALQERKFEACTSTEVLQEILYRYYAIKKPELGLRVYELFVELCPVVFPVTLEDTDAARRILQQNRRLGVRDAMHLAVMHNHGVKIIATFDRDFENISGIRCWFKDN